MSVLSDNEIRDLISQRHLISDPVDDRIISCSYEFRPGVIISTGGNVDEHCVRDWTGKTGSSDVYSVEPGALVWIRTLEKVAMPEDICAFWWQTNRLSRQGLMLVNMSMVEPGYQGPLACLFVNFGNKTVYIDPNSAVAKLVFNRLGKPADKPLAVHPDDIIYDREIVRAAMGTPVTFLAVGELETNLERKRIAAISDIQAEQSKAKSDIRAEQSKVQHQLNYDAENIRNNAQKAFEQDSKSLIRKVLGAAAVGFVLVVAAMTFVPWLQSTVQPNLSTVVQRQVDNAISERLLLSGGVITLQQFQQLQNQVKTLEQELKSRSTGGASGR